MTYLLMYFTAKSMSAKHESFKDLHEAVIRQLKLSKRKGFVSSVLIVLPSGQIISSKRCVLTTQQSRITCVER